MLARWRVPNFQLRSVTLQGLKLELDEEARLEQAITTAVNEAIQAVAKQKGERLKQVMGRG